MKKKLALVALWIVTVFETVTMGAAGAAKFLRPDVWQGMFADWGYPIWLASVIGAIEVAGAVSLLIPRVAMYAAGILILIMIGALTTVLIHNSELGWQAPVMHLVLLSVIGYARARGGAAR